MLTAYKKTRAYRTTKLVQGKLQLPAAAESTPPAQSPTFNPENANAAKEALATQNPPVYHNKTIVESCLGTKTIIADTKMECIPRLELAALAIRNKETCGAKGISMDEKENKYVAP